MKKLTTILAVLLAAVALFAVACGDSSNSTTTSAAGITTTASEAATTSTQAGTSSTAGEASTTLSESSTTLAGVTSTVPGSTSSSLATTSTAAGATTTTMSTGTSGGPSVTLPIDQIQIELTGDQVVPPVTTDAVGKLVIKYDQTQGLSYELSAMGLTRDQVTSAGIYLSTTGATSSTATTSGTGTTATTSATGAGGSQQAEMVIDLLAGSSTATTMAGGTSTTAATGTWTVLASGPFTEANLVGSLSNEDVSALIPLLLTSQAEVYVQINTTGHPDGELRGVVDIQKIMQQAGGAGTSTTASGGGAAGTTTTTSASGSY